MPARSAVRPLMAALALAAAGAAGAAPAPPRPPALAPAAAAARAAWSPVASAGDRPIVASVEVRAPPGEDLDFVRALVAVRVGEPLAIAPVRRSVQLLYGTHRFANVVVRALPVVGAPGRVDVVVECLPRLTAASMAVADAPRRAPLDAAAIARTAALAEGDELWPGRLEEAAERVRAALERRGYRAARVSATARGEPRAAVEIAVDEGAPTRVASLSFGPFAGRWSERLAEGLALRPGEVLDQGALEEDVRRVRARLRKEGYLRSRVGAPTVTTSALGADVVIPVDPGPEIAIRFAGALAFRPEELRARLGVENESVLDRAAIDAAAARLVAFYVSSGYAACRVDASEQALAGRVLLLFRVVEGRRYRVRAVRFPGAASWPEDRLRRELAETLQALAPPRDPGPRGDAERLAAAAGSPAAIRSPLEVRPAETWDPPAWDAAAMGVVERLRDDGHLEAAYDGIRVVLDARQGVVDVEVRIQQGPRTVIDAVAFEGNERLPASELAREVQLRPGDPVSSSMLEAARAAILARYARAGHLYARVEEVEDLAPDRTRATVRFRIDEGDEVRLGAIVVAGARRTREDVVREALALRSGEVYDPESAARSQTALLRLGVFRSVGLRLTDAEVPARVKDLTVDLSERPWRSIGSGVGFSLADGPRAFVELTQPNLRGRALELSARAKVNYPLETFRPDVGGKGALDKVEGRGGVTLRDPRFRVLGLPPVGARVDAIVERLHRQAYDLTRASTVFGVDLAALSRVSVQLQYELEVDSITKRDVLILTQADLERLRYPDGVTTLNSLRPVFTVDFRDSSVNPRRGWLATGTAEYVHSLGAPGSYYAFGIIPGSAAYTNMLKFSGGLSGYVPLWTRSVLALSLRGGRVVPLASDSQTIGPKRFYLGGTATMRGFGEDSMLPEDDRARYLSEIRACAAASSAGDCSDAARRVAAGQFIPSDGGQAFLLGKAEVRLPLAESVEAGLFADVGNLWADPHLVALADLRLNVGFGLRVQTPIGPAVFDLGFNPNRDTRLGESLVAPHFSIGVF